MTVANKTSAGIGTVAALAIIGSVAFKEEPKFDHANWGGFAPVTAQATANWKEGTNQYECLFEYDPDKWISKTNIEERVDRVRNPNGNSPYMVTITNRVEKVEGYHPGIALVFLNGERIGTNLIAEYSPSLVTPHYLAWLAIRATEAQ